MNILFIGTTDILGGAAKVSWDLKTALEEAGHTTAMFVADKHSQDSNVHVIPRQKWRKYLGFFLGTENLISTDWIMKTKEYQEADIIHCHNLHGRFFNLNTLQKMSEEKPVIWTLHDEWAITPHCAYTLEGTGMSNGLYTCPSIKTPPRILWNNSNRLAKDKTSIYNRSTLNIVTPSKWLYDRVKKTPLGKQSIHHIPNGTDTSKFVHIDKTEARKKLNLPLEKKIVLFLANDAKNNTWKGWKYAQEIIEHKHDDANVLFLSVGNLSRHKSESNITHHGQVNGPENLSLYYSAADVLLFTSIAENFPLVILEAMSCGLPIITFNVGGVAEVVAHEKNGLIVEYGNLNALEEALDKALQWTDLEYSNIRNNSVEKIKSKYDLSQMISAYKSLYNTINRHG